MKTHTVVYVDSPKEIRIKAQGRKESGSSQASRALSEAVKVRNLEDKPLTAAEGLALKRADAEASRAEITRLRAEYEQRIKEERKFNYSFDKKENDQADRPC